VTADQDAIFTPCSYSLTDVQLLQGSSENLVQEIVSFRGRFCDQARVGDLIQASGTVEQAIDRSGHAWHRLLLGNSVADTMFVMR
ncbi:MAG TPA: hypothetical protein VKF38_17370, partial [Anaerolineaceae bacterium]|nr:hypothetical protein [Anaerolineaceae bacterium]